MNFQTSRPIPDGGFRSTALWQRERILDALDRLIWTCSLSTEVESPGELLDEMTELTRKYFDAQVESWHADIGQDRLGHRESHHFLLDFLQCLRDDLGNMDKGLMLVQLHFIDKWLAEHFREDDLTPA